MARIPSGLCGLAAAALLASAAMAQQGAAPADQTPGEIAAIDLLNRGQTELSREEDARRVAARARAQAEYDAWTRAVAYNEELQAEYRETLRRQEEDYQRTLAEHARLAAACRAGDRAACDVGWLALGLTPPGR